MSLKIAQIARDWTINGGLASYVRDLVAALESAGHEVAVVHADEPAGGTPGRQRFQVPWFSEFGEGPEVEDRARRVLEILEHFRPDVVHVQCNDNFVLEGAIRARYPAVKTMHVYDFCPSGNKFHFASDRPCQHPTGWACVPRMAYKRCTRDKRPHVWWNFYRRATAANASNAGYAAVLVASEYVRRQALASGYPPGQVRTLPYFTVAPPAVPPPPARPGTMLFCGRLAPEKGLDLLMRAAARLDRPWRLLVAGDGMERRPAEAIARRLGIADRVEFRGWTDRDQLSVLYQEAAVVVVASRWAEPFGIVGLEAMARARPVVAFAVGGIPEWLEHGVTGYLVRPFDLTSLADRLRTLLHTEALAQDMGARGRARVERDFTAARHLERLLAIYEDVRAAFSRSRTAESTCARQ